MNFKQGIRDGIPIGLGYAAVSFAFGILAVDKDLTVSEAVLISLTNLTSAGQFAGLTIIAAVPLFILSGMLEMENWIRVLLIGIGLVVIVGGGAIACVLDREAGAFECPECHNRFVPDMKSYIMGSHTITKRKLVCPHCGAHKYCKKVLTK